MNSLDCIFNPRSVAIVGASNDKNSWGNWLAEEVIANKHKRKIYFVNPNAYNIFGKDCLRSVEQISGELDLAVVAVPRSQVERTVNFLIDRGVKAVIIITAGFGEKNHEGLDIEKKLASKAQQAGVILIGPNCAGVYSKDFRCLPIGEFGPGPVAIISQSGGVLVDVYERLEQLGLGFSRAISIGNQSQTSFREILPYLEQDPDTKVIALYVENTESIPLTYIGLMTKPVLVLSAETTPKAKEAAQQHTNSLLAHTQLAVNSISDLVAKIQMSLYNKNPKGKGLAVVTDTGGIGVMICSLAERAGLDVKSYIDLVGIPSAFSERTQKELCSLLEMDQIDSVIMNLHLYNEAYNEEQGALMLMEILKSSNKPVVFSCRSFSNPGIKILLSNSVPVYRDIETAVRMLIPCG